MENGLKTVRIHAGVKVAKPAYEEPLKDLNTTQQSNHLLSLPLNANT